MGDGDTGRIPPAAGNAPWEQVCREEAGDNFPIDASVDISVRADLPGHGADPDHRLIEDWFLSYHIPLLSSLFGRGGIAFGLRGGEVTATIPLRMRGGALCIGEELVGLEGAYFEDLIGDEGAPFRVESIARDREGRLRLRGHLVDFFDVGDIRVIDSFANEVRIFGDYPYAFPFGFDANGDLVFDSDARDTVTDPLPYLTALRLGGLPVTMSTGTLLALADELARVQASGQQPPADPDLVINIPEAIQNDPLSILPGATIGGRITVVNPPNGGERRLHLPGLQGNPPVEILFGDQTSELTLDGTLTNTDRSRIEATLNAQFDIISFKIGDAEIAAPLQGNWNVAGRATGILPTENPQEIWAHIAVNGWLTLAGDIVVPAMQGFPEIRITRGAGTNELSAHLALGLDNEVITPHGTITGILDWEEMQIGIGESQVTFPGVTGRFDLAARDSGITAELAAQVMLPRQSFPLPLPVAIERGYLQIDNFRLFIAPHPAFDPASGELSASGNFSGRIALADVGLNLDGTDLSLASSLATNGDFTIDRNLINLSAHTDLRLRGSSPSMSASADLGIDLAINDYGYCDPDGSYVTWRHLDLENLGGEVSVEAGEVTIEGSPGTFADGPIAELGDRLIAGGVHIIADFEGMYPGLITDATINTQLNHLQVTTPQGTLDISGQLVGTLQLVNISSDPSRPDLRPVVGSIHLELRDGTVTLTQEGESDTLLADGTLIFQDNASGEMSLTAQARHPIGNLMDRLGASRLRETLGIPATIESHLDIPEILFAPPETIQPVTACEATIHLSGIPPVCAADDTISFYNTDALDRVNLPSIVLGVPPLFEATGRARIADIQSGNPTTEFSGQLPFGHRELGPITTDGGRILVRKRPDEEIIRVSIIPPTRITVPSFTREVDGITYEYQVELNHSGTIHASINPTTERVRVRSSRSHPPELTGRVTVTARNSEGEVVGAGELEIETGFEVTGTATRSGATFTLRIPETGIVARTTTPITSGDLTIGAGSMITLPIHNFAATLEVDASTGTVTGTFDVPHIGSGDDAPEIAITSVDIAGMGDTGHLENVTADLDLNANGQQWELVFANDQINVRTLPGEDGQPHPLRFTATVGEANNALAIRVTSTTRADISALVPLLQGEQGLQAGTMEFSVTGFELNSEVDGAIVRPLPINLDDLNTLVNLPGAHVTFNPTTRELNIRITPPQPNLPTPPASYEEFFGWTTEQWRDYSSQLTDPANRHLFRQSPRGAELPGAITDYGMPTGQGDILINAGEPIEATLFLDDPTLTDKIGDILNRSLDRRRVFPNPPPRRGIGDSVIFSEAQSRAMRSEEPYGTFFFPRFVSEEGQIQTDPELANILTHALGIPHVTADGPSAEGFVLNQRIEFAELLDIVMADETSTLRDRVSREALESLLRSYFDPAVARGTLNQNGARALITLGNIRTKLGDILQSSERGVRNIQAHYFADEAYHDGEGTLMQYTSFLPAAPEQVGAVLEDLSGASEWDPWLRSGNGLTGNFLGDYDYDVTPVTGEQGPVRVYHIHLTPGENSFEESLDAYTRTVRLVPLANGGTLMVWEEHIDLAGNDQEIRAPRRILPDRPVIDINTLSTGLLQAISPTEINLPAQYANRFARISHSLNALAEGQPRSEVTPQVEAIDYNSNSGITQTVRIVDFLSLATEGEGTEAIDYLVLNPDVSNAIIRPFFTDRLGIAATTVNRWIGSTERRIPLDELRTEAGLDTYMTLPVFTGLVHYLLTPSADVQRTYDKFTSQTERLFIVLQDMKERLPTLATLSGGSRPVDFRVLNAQRFHQGISAGSSRQGDTADTYTYWFVPADDGFTIEQYAEVINHAEDYDRIDPNFVAATTVTDHPDADPTRVYTDTELKIPLADNLLYRISATRDPLQLAGNVHLSTWILEHRHNVTRQGFYDNAGTWGFIPVTVPGEGGTMREGWLVIRAGILNSNAPVDRHPQVESTGRDGLVAFAEETTAAAEAYDRTGNREAWSDGNPRPLHYRIGRVIDENGANVNR